MAPTGPTAGPSPAIANDAGDTTSTVKVPPCGKTSNSTRQAGTSNGTHKNKKQALDTKMDQDTLLANLSEEKREEIMHKDVQDILENDLSCAICRDIYINPLILNCSHSFCKFCVYRWLSGKTECPECRMIVSFQAENLALRNIINRMVQKSSPQFQKNRTNNVNQRLKDEEEQKQDGTLNSVIKYDTDRENLRDSRSSVLQNVFPHERDTVRQGAGADVVGIQWFSVPSFNSRRNRPFFESDPGGVSMYDTDEDSEDEDSEDDGDTSSSDSEDSSIADAVLGDLFEIDSDASETPTNTDESDIETSDDNMVASWSSASSGNDEDMVWLPREDPDDDDTIDWDLVISRSPDTGDTSSSSDEIDLVSSDTSESDFSFELPPLREEDRYSDDSTIAYGTSDDSG